MGKPTNTVMEHVQEFFPQILKVAMNIAYDNGTINRNEGEKLYLERVAYILEHRPVSTVIKLELFLRDKADEALNLIAAGEHKDAQDELSGAPDIVFANKLFDEFFEGE